jgi:hypothetical protein
MFVKLLRIDSGPFGETAISRRLTEEFVQRWLAEKPWWRGHNPRSHHNCNSGRGCSLGLGKLHPQRVAHAQQNEILKLSAELITELTDAAELTVGKFLLALVQKRMVLSLAALRETLKNRIESLLETRTVNRVGRAQNPDLEKGQIRALLKSYERGDFMEDEDAVP